MKYAKVTYIGAEQSNAYNLPGDVMNRPRSFTRGVPVAIETLEAVQYCEDQSQFDVDWTARGRVAKALTDDEYDSPEAMLEDYGYRAKQSLAKAFGIKANKPEEELQEELEQEVAELQEQMENL